MDILAPYQLRIIFNSKGSTIKNSLFNLLLNIRRKNKTNLKQSLGLVYQINYSNIHGQIGPDTNLCLLFMAAALNN